MFFSGFCFFVVYEGTRQKIPRNRVEFSVYAAWHRKNWWCPEKYADRNVGKQELKRQRADALFCLCENRWWPEKYAGSYKAIVNVVKSQIKYFEVVEQFL